MTSSLEHIYNEHHTKRRGDFFVVHATERGAFLRDKIGIGKRVLDIGCRDGALTGEYANGNTVVGVDIDSAALARAKEKLGIQTIHADLNGEWPVEGPFDAAVACEVVEHLYYPDTVFRKLYATLRPGGVLAGTVPHAFSLQCRLRLLVASKKGTPLQDPTHITHFSVSELRRTIAAAGFEDVQIETLIAPKFRLLSKLFPYTFAFDLLFSARRPSGS